MEKKDPTLNENQLGNLLLRYKKNLKPPQASVQKEFVAVVEEVTGLILRNDQVEYSVATKTIVLKTPSLLRSELKLKHPEIMSLLVERLGRENAPIVML